MKNSSEFLRSKLSINTLLCVKIISLNKNNSNNDDVVHEVYENYFIIAILQNAIFGPAVTCLYIQLDVSILIVIFTYSLDG